MGKPIGGREVSAAHGILYSQLAYWRPCQETASNSEGAFLEVEAPVAVERALVEVRYPDGMQVRFFAPVSASHRAQQVCYQG